MAIIFDMDGLLLDTEPLWGESMLAIASQHGVNIKSDFFKYTTGLRINEVTAFWKVKFGWTSAISSDEMANEIVTDIIQRSLEKGSIMPGVMALLNQCKDAGIAMGVATSSPSKMMNALLSNFGIMSFFAACVSADTCEYGKPHPGVYLQCAQALGTDAWQCVAMEDSINGMVAAKAARMKVVAIPENALIQHPAFGLANLTIPSMEQFSLQNYQELLLQ